MTVPPAPVRVRLAPSPTGYFHVGGARTALYNWAFARHHGGTFVLRIEDTDKERSTEESYRGILELFSWLGLSWDEGVEVGGPYGPYRQSERTELYRDVLAKLAASSFTYDCFCTTDEVEARRKASGSKVVGYDGFCRELTAAQRAAFEAEGRTSVVRFRMPEGSITWNDLVRGEVTFETQYVPDFALCRANGDPLYTLTAPVDDATMHITHVLRGEDLLSSTPRQIALFDAMREIGVAEVTPAYGHLPYVMGQGNKKLSKRDPEANALSYRDQGYLPEGLLNYMALLGWSIAADRDVFTTAEMVDAFEIGDVNPNPARFDLKKCTAINADWIRRLGADAIAERLLSYLVAEGVLPEVPNAAQRELLRAAVPHVQERMETLRQGVNMLSFLFAGDSGVSSDVTAGTPKFVRDAADVAAVISDDTKPALRAAHDAIASVADWTTGALEEALRSALIDGLGLKPKVAFGPVRVAVSGRRVSPPLFESIELLGRERTLARLHELL